jgi:hypothetical protein
MLAKSLPFLAGADSAGIVLGARVPVILTGQADTLMARLASRAIASLVAAALTSAYDLLAARASRLTVCSTSWRSVGVHSRYSRKSASSSPRAA